MSENNPYSDRSKFPWGAVVVAGAVGVFGCIIVGALVARNLLGANTLGGGITAGATQSAPAGSIAVDISSSNTKEDWMNAVIEKFNAEQHKIASGEVIFVRVEHVTSGGSQQAILGGKSQPTVWSPGDQSWIDTANQTWQDRNSRALVSGSCPATVLAPIGFAMWRPMAEALGWPDKPISWETLTELSANPDGWASIGHPEWGKFKFGHTHPDFSNSGLLIMTALAYSAQDKTSGLTADEVYADKVVQAFTQLEQNTYHYGIQSRPLMQLLAKRGPDYLHAVNTSEAETLKTNVDFKDQLRFQLVFIFPAKGTFWTEQPYCILDGADWVTTQQEEAAQIFRDYLLDPAQQTMAISNYLRPVDTTVALGSPFTLADGTDPRVTLDTVPALQSPSAEVSAAVKDVFHQTKKKATVVLVIDTSGSMEGDRIKAAVESSVNFVGRFDPQDKLYALGFGGDRTIYDIGGGKVGDVGEELEKSISGLYASGNTPLYDAVCEAATKIDALKAEDVANGERRLYGIVVLSDGEDTSSLNSENQMFNCLPSGEDVEGVKVFTIAYGEEANADLMLRIANRTNGKTFKGDPASIENIYNSISAEQ